MVVVVRIDLNATFFEVASVSLTIASSVLRKVPLVSKPHFNAGPNVKKIYHSNFFLRLWHFHGISWHFFM